ncbi:hypothetical protein HR12_28705 [Microbacterium sp. SUBG005]|nr:hypothetical protein HR12_28705 [Microbacterium sp. SUBG005]
MVAMRSASTAQSASVYPKPRERSIRAEGMTFTPMPRKSSCTTVSVSTVTVAVVSAAAGATLAATASEAITVPTVASAVHRRTGRGGCHGGLHRR